MSKKYFTVTKRHLALLKRACVYWYNYDEPNAPGAPGIDNKKPYGNSDILIDVAEIIGLPIVVEGDGAKRFSDHEQRKLCEQLHQEIEIALQILLSNCHIEIGQYECERGTDWIKVK